MSLYCICTTTTSLAVSCHQLQFHTNWSSFPALQETQKVNGSQCRPSVDRFVRYVALFVRPVTKVLVFLATCLLSCQQHCGHSSASRHTTILLHLYTSFIIHTQSFSQTVGASTDLQFLRQTGRRWHKSAITFCQFKFIIIFAASGRYGRWLILTCVGEQMHMYVWLV